MGDQNSNRVDYTTMKTFQILAILACVAGLNAGSIVGKPIVGKCPPVITTKPDFDYKQYAGIWYEIERVPVIFESGMSCVQATYNEISLVEDGLPQRHTKCERRLLAVDQVLLALQFFATGTFQSVVGNVLRVSQRSVGRSIHAVARALCRLGPKIMTIDKTNLVPLQEDFAEIANMPGVFGCIDGTHVRISRPYEWEASYVNRKGYHSINVQGVCDAKYKFIDLTVKQPGSVHDSTMFKVSGFGKKCALGWYGEGFVLGDSGYGSTPYIITPYNNPQSPPEERFNRAHKTTRCVIQRAFGILKRRFHCLHTELRLQPGPASRVIAACCVLHNISIDRRQINDYEYEDEEEMQLPIIDHVREENGLVLRQQGFEKRNNITLNYFT